MVGQLDVQGATLHIDMKASVMQLGPSLLKSQAALVVLIPNSAFC